MTHDTTLALIDVSHIFRSAWAASGDENISKAYEVTMKAIVRIANSRQYTHTIVCCDAPPYKRADFFPAYKANREAPDHQMIEQMRRVMDRITKMGIKVARAKGYEADDCIATLVRHAEELGWESTIYSADKDLHQLVSAKTRMVSTRDSGTVFDVAKVIEAHGVHPKDMVTFLALCGDKADNVPGVPGVGPKKAAKLIAEFGTLENILASSVDGALGEALRANQTQALTSAVLVELDRNVPLVWGELTSPCRPVVDKPLEPLESDDFMNDESTIVPLPRAEEVELPTAGDRLVGGALSLQEVPTLVPVATPANVPANGPGVARVEDDEIEGIELRPGLTMSRGQFQLLRRLAHYFWQGGLYARKFQSEAAIFTVMELGVELGMSPQIALNNFEIVDGRPAPGAHYLIARASADPNCEYLEMTEENFEVEDPYVTFETKSRASGRVKTFTYRWSDAEKAGVIKGKSTWNFRPREMMRKTAGSQAARLWYPGACAGLYSMEELGVLPGEVERVA